MTEPTTNWRDKLVHDEDGMMRAVLTTHRIAVLGIKADEGEPEFEGPIFMQGSGFEIVPVAVDSGHADEILGERVYERVADIPGSVDVVDVFVPGEDLPRYVDDIVAKHPRFVWLESGIRNDEAAERLAREGIEVVQDESLKTEYIRLSAL